MEWTFNLTGFREFSAQGGRGPIILPLGICIGFCAWQKSSHIAKILPSTMNAQVETKKINLHSGAKQGTDI